MPPEASVLPSGLKATDCIASPLPLRVARTLPVRTSHNLIASLTSARVCPSGLYATDSTRPSPLKLACSLPVVTSHSLIVPPSPPEATVCPSGLYTTDHTGPTCPLRG